MYDKQHQRRHRDCAHVAKEQTLQRQSLENTKLKLSKKKKMKTEESGTVATSWGGGQRRFSAGTPGSGGATGAEQDREAAQGGGWGLQGVAWDFLFPVLPTRMSVLSSP